MNKLSQECIEQIEEEANNVYLPESLFKNDFREGSIAALTNPNIYQSAGLMTVEEALRFAEWVDDSTYIFNSDIGRWFRVIDNYVDENFNSDQLLTIFRQQNQEK